jgi:hypothetical protein
MSFSIGAPAGWRTEARRLTRVDGKGMVGHLEINVVCRGEHASRCEHTDSGWVCEERCLVEDMRTMTPYPVQVQELLGVEKGVERERKKIWKWFVPLPRVDYWATRISQRYKFENGRRRADQLPDIDYETLYRGVCLTKRGARIKLNQAIWSDLVELDHHLMSA